MAIVDWALFLLWIGTLFVWASKQNPLGLLPPQPSSSGKKGLLATVHKWQPNTALCTFSLNLAAFKGDHFLKFQFRGDTGSSLENWCARLTSEIYKSAPSGT